MKKLLLLLIVACTALTSVAQNVDGDRINVRTHFTMPLLDTVVAAIKIGELRTRPQDSLEYRWNGLRWITCRCSTNIKDTIPLFHIGAGAPALRPIYAINGALRASNWGAGYGWVPRLLGDSTMVGDVDTTSIAYKQWVINQFSPGGPFSIGFQNGLSLVGSNAELGANPLLHNTTIDATGLYTLSISGSGSNTVLNIFNSSSGLAAQIQGTSSPGVNISTLTGAYALSTAATPATTNTSTKIINVLRTSSGTPAIGMGGYIGYQLTDAGNFTQESGRLNFVWTDAAHATFTSQFILQGVSAGAASATWMDASGTTANFYGTSVGVRSINGVVGAVFQGTTSGASAASALTPLAATNVSTGTTNGILTGINVSRQAAFTGATGEGISIDFGLVDASGGIAPTGNIISKYTNATAGASSTQYDFTVINAGVLQTKFSIGSLATFMTATRFQTSMGSTVASANNLTLGTDGNVFHISGTTTINAITIANWQAGSEFVLIFDGSLTVKNNTAGGGGTAIMKLAGAADFAATADDELTLTWDGTSFREKGRSVN